jgi:hypothetical protein
VPDHTKPEFISDSVVSKLEVGRHYGVRICLEELMSKFEPCESIPTACSIRGIMMNPSNFRAIFVNIGPEVRTY